ncbi:hypothetical protein XPA_003101 [Xanthoria parietina]
MKPSLDQIVATLLVTLLDFCSLVVHGLNVPTTTTDLLDMAYSNLTIRGNPAPKGCTFTGTAPFCFPHDCPKDYVITTKSHCGTGHCCWLGWKWQCCKKQEDATKTVTIYRGPETPWPNAWDQYPPA